MKKLLLLISWLLFIPVLAYSQTTLDDYLPDDVTYDESIPTPKEVIGHEIGEWHITHDKLVQYMYAIAEASDRVTIKEYARTYENRPLLLLTITSPENQSSIDRIKENHKLLKDPGQSDNLDLETMPVVVYLGYSIHGNEPSGSNASPLTLYHLAAGQGESIEDLLDNSVILLDPSLNPDGFQRFSTWVNMHKSHTEVTDPASREYNEVWPRGRTNHYWFDLNRDWMPVQHPESRGRILQYQEWMPNVLTDFHEMGTNATYFFQPGVPSRTNPLTTQRNQDLTMSIAEFHADALDDIQSLYYTRENFDDFYYGKGSTYPDLFGTIGILFEQASSRGHAQESIHGVLRFPFTIKNQFTTSLSTLEASHELKVDLHQHMRALYQEYARESAQSNIKGIVVGDSKDSARNYHLADLLNHHQIEMYELARDLEAGGHEFEQGKAWVIPTEQPHFKFIEAMFEDRTQFPDSIFYDVSTWTLSFSFNLPSAELTQNQYSQNLLGSRVEDPQMPTGQIVGGRSNYAYVFEWDEYYAPRALYRLQKMGVRTKVATAPFRLVTTTGLKEFGYGSILVALGTQDVDEREIFQTLQQAAREDGVTIYNMRTGLSANGIDLGSPSFSNLDKPNVAMLGGFGLNSSEVGEVWHLFDQRYQIPLTIIEKHIFEFTDLNKYNVLVLPSGRYSDLSENAKGKIKTWAREGGTLITLRGAVNWAKNEGLIDLEYRTREEDEDEETEPLPYATLRNTRGAQVIGGSIFNGILDITHPIGYGYSRPEIKMFRNTNTMLEMPDNPYATPVFYSDDPLASGYISSENLDIIGGTASVVVSSYGSGKVITFVDNPNFRAFWFGTNKLFANAVFFGQIISGASAN